MEYYFQIIKNEGNLNSPTYYHGRRGRTLKWASDAGLKVYRNLMAAYSDAHQMLSPSLPSVVIIKRHLLPNGNWRNDPLKVIRYEKEVKQW